MSCVQVTYLKLTNARFCVIWARMDHFEARLMVLSQKVDTNVLRMEIQLKYFNKKNANVRNFLYGMNPNVPTVEVRVLLGYFKF